MIAHTFNLSGREYVELKNLLKLMGVFESGGEAMAAVAAGEVSVDGAVELRKRCKIRAGQVVECAGQKIVVV
ncbi:MAG: RNA-binding S4 domain-containing protein [Thermodesulfobacteriota bacterium]